MSNDVFICAYGRTPIGAFQGCLSQVPATKLGSIVIEHLVNETPSIDINLIDEVIMGNVLSANLGQAPSRQAALGGGLNNSVECLTINKVCGSGLKSIMLAEQSIKSNASNIIIAGGMENMSLAPYYLENSRKGMMFGNNNVIDSILKDGLWDPYNDYAMGNCAEVLNKEYKFSREEQDAYAIESYKRANQAISNGDFKNEIINVKFKNKGKEVVIDTDEEPLKFNKDKISKIKPAFDKNGSITAANASSLSDGSAGVLLASQEMIKKQDLIPIAKIIGHASFATKPLYFTKAPIDAIKKVLKLSNFNLDDIDLFEINEAFACVPMLAMKELNIPHNKVNINGGAVALGHPIGASGARILVTLLNALIKQDLKYGIACLCIGGGEASAMIVERFNK